MSQNRLHVQYDNNNSVDGITIGFATSENINLALISYYLYKLNLPLQFKCFFETNTN